MHPHYSWRNLAYDNGVNVYSYQFSKENGYYGTYHSGELVYVYSSFKKSGHEDCYDESDKKLGQTMHSYWTNFGKSGNPNGEGLPTWCLYNKADFKIMELGKNVGPIKDPHSEFFPIIDDYINYRLANPKTK